jgi:tRNA pseudouridine38-40 synthase
VSGEIEEALARILRLPELPRLTVAGRTDAGVHAIGQVAHADLPPTEETALARRLNRLLPEDVRVRQVAVAAPGFDARFSALSRCYRYRLSDAPYGVDPLRRHHSVTARRTLDVAAMARAAAGLVGEHDFAAYCRRREGATTVRQLLRLGVFRDEAVPTDISVVAEADAFCHSMVRALVGALLAVGEGRRPVGWPATVLAGRQRDAAVLVAPARGLTLEVVRYPPDSELAERARRTRRVRTGC